MSLTWTALVPSTYLPTYKMKVLKTQRNKKFNELKGNKYSIIKGKHVCVGSTRVGRYQDIITGIHSEKFLEYLFIVDGSFNQVQVGKY